MTTTIKMGLELVHSTCPVVEFLTENQFGSLILRSKLVGHNAEMKRPNSIQTYIIRFEREEAFYRKLKFLKNI